MPVPDDDAARLWWALNRLLADYWDEVDRNGGSNAHEFYLPDALYAVGGNRFEGVEKIRAFYARRRQFGNTTTRHLISNLQAFPDGARHARAVGMMSLYRADGRAPIRGMKAPAMIADFEVLCVAPAGGEGDDRPWRFRQHLLRPIFVSSDLPASISIDPQRL
jgi:hypothetical protein